MGCSFEEQKEHYNYLFISKNFLEESRCKPNKIWVDKGSEFYNRPMKSRLKHINTEIY